MFLLLTLVSVASVASSSNCKAPFDRKFGAFCVHVSSQEFDYCAAQKYCRALGGELLIGETHLCDHAVLLTCGSEDSLI